MHNTDFEYLPQERKVICKLGRNIIKEHQQQLDYIANAIHDTGFTPEIKCSDHGTYPSLDIKYNYEGKEQGIYFRIDLDALDEDNTIVTLVLPRKNFQKVMHYPAHSSRCSLFKKVSQKYFIGIAVESAYVNYIPTIGTKKFESPTILLLEGVDLAKIKWISFCSLSSRKLVIEEFLQFVGKNNKEMLPEIEKITIKGTIRNKDCELLSNLISEGMFAGKLITINLGQTNFYMPYFSSTMNSDYDLLTDRGALKLINASKSKADAVISLHLCSSKISSNIQNELKELNNNINNTIKLMTSLVKESISYKKEALEERNESKEKEEFEKIVQKEFLQILKEDILEVFWKLKNNPKIHKKILEKINHNIKDNTAHVQTDIKTILTKASAVMFNKYIRPDIKDIQDLKDLPSNAESLVRFIKLPPELQEHILQFAGSKIFSSCFSKKELQGINDLKEICILLDKIKTAAKTEDDCVQSNKLLLSKLLSHFKTLPPELQKCVKDSIKSLVFDTKIAAIFSSTDAESSYNLLQSKVNEVEGLSSKLQEQIIDDGAEVAISDNVLAYDVVDSNNTDQMIEDLSLVGNYKNHDLI